MMSCRKVQSLVSAYLDGELGGHDMLEMRSHVTRCAECAREIEKERAVRSLLADLQAPEAPDDLDLRLTAAVFSPRPAPRPWIPAVFLGAVTTAAAASAILYFSWTSAPARTLQAENPQAQPTLAFHEGGDPFGAYVPQVVTASQTFPSEEGKR